MITDADHPGLPLIGALILLAGTATAPFIYPLV
jgi:hypothetical protein